VRRDEPKLSSGTGKENKMKLLLRLPLTEATIMGMLKQEIRTTAMSNNFICNIRS
jgi:hypothetical protein